MTLLSRVLASLFISTVLLAPVLLTSEAYWGAGQDLLLAHHPLRDMAYQALRNGEWPLWNPYSCSGLPYQTGFRTLAYPVHFLGLWMSAAQVTKASMFLHCFLGCFGTMSFLAWLGFGLRAGMVAGATFSGSGFMMARLFAGHLDWTEPFAFLPLVIWSVCAACRYRGLAWTLLAGLSLGVMAMAGNYQPVYLAVVGFLSFQLTLFGLGSRYAVEALDWKTPWNRELSDRSPEESPWALLSSDVEPSERGRDLLTFLPRFFLIGATSLGLAAFRLLPSAQSALASNRLQAPEQFSGSGHSLWSQLTYLVPHFYEGTTSILCWSDWPSWERQYYLGVVLLGLASIALRAPKRVWLPPFCVSVLAFAMTLGDSFLLYPLWKTVDPLLQNFRAPGRFSLLIAFFAAWLGAIGVEFLERRKPDSKKLLLSISPLLLLLGLFSLRLLGWQSDPEGWARFVHPLTNREAWSFLLQAHADSLIPLLSTSLGRALISLSLVGALATVLASRPKITGKAITSLVLFDLLLFAQPYLKTAPITSFEVPATVREELKKLPPGARVQWDPSLQWFDRLAPEFVGDVAGYEYFLAPRYTAAANLAAGLPETLPRTLLAPPLQEGLWNLQGAALLISGRALESPSLELIRQADNLYLYRNPEAFPRLFAVGELRPGSLAQLVETSQRSLPTLRQLAYAEESWGEQGPVGEEITELQISCNSVTAQVQVPEPAVLVLTDTPWPGWRVEVDGQLKDLLSLNGGLHRGVKVEAGSHRVEFRYWPQALTLGLAISGFTWLLLLGLARPWKYRRP